MLASMRTRRRATGSHAAATEPVSQQSFIVTISTTVLTRLPAANAAAPGHSSCHTTTGIPHRSATLAAYRRTSSTPPVEKRVVARGCSSADIVASRSYFCDLVRHTRNASSFDKHLSTIVHLFQSDPWCWYSYRWSIARLRHRLGQASWRLHVASGSACLPVNPGGWRRPAPGRSRLLEPGRAPD